MDINHPRTGTILIIGGIHVPLGRDDLNTSGN